MKRFIRATSIAAAGCAVLLGTAGAATADDEGGGASGALSYGAAVNSPGVLSGNIVQIPVGIPINICGNTVDIIGLLNPAFGNTCVNE
ncbi:chaplin [Streptomyces sp. MST-110588]|uniref:chaplin n=1 Tax=Streptomyces sp. MST-110588 TaxID=2833628 RepID=UPI001F5DEB4C|nr:chaplin [Streptomyces sp. MST-110588]UNO43230.1 chaplin [Streptomyces sp. MST-110588]